MTLKLYLANGELAGLWDVCQWWADTYPEDVFISEPVEVVEIRNQMKRMMGRVLNGN